MHKLITTLLILLSFTASTLSDADDTGKLDESAAEQGDAQAQYKGAINCSAATLPVELAICKNDELIRLDNQLGKRYLEVLGFHMGDRGFLPVEEVQLKQDVWTSTRDQCGLGVTTGIDACLKKLYENRLQDFEVCNVELAASGSCAMERANQAKAKVKDRLDNVAAQISKSKEAEYTDHYISVRKHFDAYQAVWIQLVNTECSIQAAITGGAGSWQYSRSQSCVSAKYQSRIDKLNKVYRCLKITTSHSYPWEEPYACLRLMKP